MGIPTIDVPGGLGSVALSPGTGAEGVTTDGVSAEARPKNYGFLIDNGKCIGCHACSTACKSENEVPLGVYRTWVKTTETGAYPDTKRHFQVTRCNHCANPPCVRICPTQAMVQRDDGIVEFDKDACIGCKACMQACPYDAIHVDPVSKTAAKCHFCSHRTDIGLEPACVVVCPEHAIVAGDLNDPLSEISRLVAKNQVTVRKPEQGTAPKLFYIQGNDVNQTPTAGPGATVTMATVDVRDPHGHVIPEGRPADNVARHAVPIAGLSIGRGKGSKLSQNPETKKGYDYASLRKPQHQGLPNAGPIQIGGKRAEHMVQVGYNAQHKVPWHWPVPAYLVTKGIGAGVLGLMAAAWLMGLPFSNPVALAGTFLGVAMMGITTALLVYDLERPERFLYILKRPNWSSWLVRGAVFLIGLSNLGAAWFGLEGALAMGWITPELATTLRTPIMALTVPFAIGGAVYTAFLFGQAEGRDLWQSPLLPAHLFVQATMMGGASLALLGAVMDVPTALASLGFWAFTGGLLADAAMTLTGELGMPHASEVAAQAAEAMRSGRYSRWFWGGGVVLGHVVPLALLATGVPALGAVAALAAIAGLYAYEHAFVMAPQEVPNS